jgi:phosphopantothenoylcysteine decarboxylase / phosphopantothenate---cysteine ligase
MKWVFGICGAGAAVAAPQQVLILRDHGVDVTVVLSANAHRFLNVEALTAFSRGKVFQSVFDQSDEVFVPHVELAEGADAFVIMPASAAQVARLAAGAADDLISAIAVHCDIPIFVVPALARPALDNVLIQRNLRTLDEAGMHIIFAQEAHALRAADAARVPSGFPSILHVLETVTATVSSRPEEHAQPMGQPT